MPGTGTGNGAGSVTASRRNLGRGRGTPPGPARGNGRPGIRFGRIHGDSREPQPAAGLPGGTTHDAHHRRAGPPPRPAGRGRTELRALHLDWGGGRSAEDSTRGSASRSRRGLPGLILLAGLALAGCGDDSSTTAPAPAPAPPPAPAAPAPVGVPGGLKVTASGHDFLEFGWEAVEGATGYEIQLSLKDGDFSSVSTATVTTTMHRFTVKPETAGYARVRAHEGERQGEWSATATGTSAAAPIPPVTLMAPVPEVSGSGADFIEWSWEPVADALRYEVRVAATEEGLDAASPETVEETMYRVTAEPETEMLIRVRAVAGTAESPIVSDWSDAVSGMSDAAPRPFVVGMTPPEAGADRDCSGQALCPDDGTDPEKALASVNPMMLVSSSHRARIRPLFVEGAPGVTVEAGEALTPFAYADWSLLQRTAVDEGAVFEFRKITGGAGQEATPTGAAMHITCGPFRCSAPAAEAPAAPAMDAALAAVCEDFEVDFRLIEGVFRNYQAVWINDAESGNPLRARWHNHSAGLEFGWEYTLSHPATVTHEFGSIPAATPSGWLTVPGADLEVTSVYRVLDLAPDSDPDSLVNKFGSAENRDGNRDSRSHPGPIRNGPNDCYRGDYHNPVGQYFGDLVDPSYGKFQRSVRNLMPPGQRVEKPPDRCAVLVTDGYYTDHSGLRRAYLRHYDYSPGYRLQVDPQVGVSWAGSEVAWGNDDPFANMKCGRVTFPLADQYDKCEHFREEVEAFVAGGIGDQYRLEFEFSGTSTLQTARFDRMVVRNDAPIWPDPVTDSRETPRFSSVLFGGRPGHEWRPRGSRYASMWLQRPEPGTTRQGPRHGDLFRGEPNFGIDGTLRDYDLYELFQRTYSSLGDGPADYLTGGRDARRGLREWQPIVRHELLDSDGDPIYGDLGKIDLLDAAGNPGSDGNPDNFDGNEDADRCSADDGGEELCDAVVDIPLTATFVLIRDTRTCETEMDLSVTCTWDADGDDRRGGSSFPAGPNTGRNGGNFFLECEAR